MSGKTFRLGIYTPRICGSIFIGDVCNTAGGRCKRNGVAIDRSADRRTGIVATTMTEIASGGRRRLPLRGLYKVMLTRARVTDTMANGPVCGFLAATFRVSQTHTYLVAAVTWFVVTAARSLVSYKTRVPTAVLVAGRARCVCLPDVAVAVSAVRARAYVCRGRGGG